MAYLTFLTNATYPVQQIDTSNDKEIKEEFEKLGLLEIDENLFTYDTQLGTIFNDFNRLIRINDNLFTYEIEIPKPTRCVKQQTDDPTYNDLKEYEWKMCYEECEKIYAEAVIFINNRLLRLINVTVKQWLDLKYGDHMKMDKNAKKGVIGTCNSHDEEEQEDEERCELFNDPAQESPIFKIRRFGVRRIHAHDTAYLENLTCIDTFYRFLNTAYPGPRWKEIDNVGGVSII
uniref:Importin-beta domain, armadillo-type fold protein n=1 Tax=Tanacetum cinerariifolium TaxID=118510 RepID=A0A699JF50_TANCI|nr:importin-beta domain, armadillo-type fold protein [Tanacetum cinerariifolium]